MVLDLKSPPTWGGTDLERGYGDVGVWGCAALKTPFLCLSWSSQGSHSSKSQFTRPPFEKKMNILLYSPILSSQAPKFWTFQFTGSQIWKCLVHKPLWNCFSLQAPSFRGKLKSVCQPHTSEIRAAGLHTSTWKKVECPVQAPHPNSQSLSQ